MFKNIKVIAIFFVVVSIVFVVSTVTLYVILEREKAEKATLRDELTQVMKERKRLSLEAEELRLIKTDLEVELSGLQAQAKMLVENYEKEKSQNDIVRLKLSKKTEELKGIQSKIEKIAKENEELRDSIDTETAKYRQLRERVDKLVEVKDVLEDKVRDIVNKQGIELERIVVKAEGELEGKVVVINREYNFIVVDVGRSDDIELGDFLTIFRSGKYVGEAQVEKIYDTMSAAAIIKETKSKAIMIDDNVIVRGN